MVISGKGLITSLTLRTKIPNKKQKAFISITDNNNHNLSKLIKEFKNSSCLVYKKKQVHN